MTQKVKFSAINIGSKFFYDGDTFEKTSINIAWEIRSEKQYKEWYFSETDMVMPIDPP